MRNQYRKASKADKSKILDRHDIEAQGYLDCQNILETLGRRNKAKLEAACQHLVNMRGYSTYSMIKVSAAASTTSR